MGREKGAGSNEPSSIVCPICNGLVPRNPHLCSVKKLDTFRGLRHVRGSKLFLLFTLAAELVSDKDLRSRFTVPQFHKSFEMDGWKSGFRSAAIDSG